MENPEEGCNTPPPSEDVLQKMAQEDEGQELCLETV